MGILGTPAVRWNTKADLFGQLERARLYLDSASLDEATVKSAAQEAGLSLHHFIRLFHERYGRSPLEYLCERRKRTAADLLGSTELSVSEIALEVGFESPSAFGRWFKREFHMTPSRYRAQLV